MPETPIPLPDTAAIIPAQLVPCASLIPKLAPSPGFEVPVIAL